MKPQIIYVFLTLLSFSSAKLTFVNQVFRHGIRGPLANLSFVSNNQTNMNDNEYLLHPIPPFNWTFHQRDQQPTSSNSNHNNKTKKVESTQISVTESGKKQMLLIGRSIRNEYIFQKGFLPFAYDPEVVKFRANILDRTIQSAKYVLKGMFSEEDSLLDINFAIDKVPFLKDFVYFAYFLCPNTLIKQNQLLNSLSNLEGRLQKRMNSLHSHLTNHLSTNGTIPIDSMVDFISSMKQNEAEGPLVFEEGQTAKDIQFKKDIFLLLELGGSREVIRLSTQAMLKEMLNNFDSAIEGQSQLKWQGYSGSDIQLVHLLAILNLTSWECIVDRYLNLNSEQFKNKVCLHSPNFGSNLLLELYSNEEDGDDQGTYEGQTRQKEEDYYLKVKYEGVYYPICSSFSFTCNYLHFKQIIQDGFYQDYEDECGRPIP